MITRDEHHNYTYEGQVYPGVTGILGIVDKSDALMGWAARNTAEAAITLAMDYEHHGECDYNTGPGSDRCPHGYFYDWHKPSGLDKLLDTVGAEGTTKALTSRSSWKRDEAAQLGTEVHNLADMVNHGLPTPPMSETVRKRVMHYAEWLRTSGWAIRTSEAMVVNPDLGYGGTLDLLARDADGRTVIADIKTGKAIYHTAVLQLTAYGMAPLVQAGGTQAVHRMPPVDRYVILHVTADEVRPVEVAVGELEREAWQACIALSAWRETTKGKRL